MNPTLKVSGIVIFGVVISIITPQLININTKSSLKQEETTKSSTTEIAYQQPVDTATPVVQETKEEVQEEPKEEIQEVVEPQAEPIVYDGLTLNELSEKLNRSLKSTLSGTGSSFAKYSVEMGIDPYLAVAIVLHETGCSYSCSNLVKNSNNVGGMKSGGSYASFATLDEGIYKFMYNLKTNYIDKGLTTAETINTKYAANPNWYQQINNYITKIQNA